MYFKCDDVDEEKKSRCILFKKKSISKNNKFSIVIVKCRSDCSQKRHIALRLSRSGAGIFSQLEQTICFYKRAATTANAAILYMYLNRNKQSVCAQAHATLPYHDTKILNYFFSFHFDNFVQLCLFVCATMEIVRIIFKFTTPFLIVVLYGSKC